MRNATGFLRKEDWDTLLGAIQNGKCTPFLGAGVNDGILPLGGPIAEEWARKYNYPLRDKFDLARVAQFVAIRKRDEMWPKDEILRLFKKRVATTDIKTQLKIS